MTYKPAPPPSFARALAHAAIRKAAARTVSDVCPVCHNSEQRFNKHGVWQVCECTSYSMALALEWNLPQYAPDGYVSDEDE